jgi:hypothetical protein
VASNRLYRRTVALAVIALVLGGLALASAPTVPVEAAPEQVTVNWSQVGSARSDIFHSGGAYDTDNNVLYIYGGVDPDFAPSSRVEKVDLSGTDLRATHSIVSAGSALQLVGSAGAYRAKGADAAESAAYFFGGLRDPEGGNAQNDVQRYLVKDNKWERVTPTNATSFEARFFATATYDPKHDVIWVIGGVTSCSLPSVLEGNNCTARQLSTQYLSFDDAAGTTTWNSLADADQAMFAHAAAYDAANERILVYGGTNNITRGNRDVMALDVSGATPADAKFESVATSGTAPQVYFHGVAMDTDNNWLVTYGGVTQNFLQNNEATQSGTNALDLGQSPPAWVRLSTGSNPGTRVAGVMAYAANHKASVFALGRDKVQLGDPLPSQRVQRTSWALTTEQAPTATTPPPTTPTTPTTTTPTTPTTVTPTTPPTTPPPPPAEACDFLAGKAPAQAIADAIGNPASVFGYQMLCNPNVLPSPFNTIRSQLSMSNPAKPYHPLYNALVWSCGCP